MELALIPPVDLLEYVDETQYQLMLPQLIGNDRYKYVFKALGIDHTQYVILDNGAAEGEQVTNRDLISVANEFKVNEIVLPDEIGSHPGTVAKTLAFMRDYRTFCPGGSHRFMFVIQGQTEEEFYQSLTWALMNDHIQSIGIPRHSIETTGNQFIRQELAENVQHSQYRKPVHLLGASPIFPTEIRDCQWPAIVRGHDTSSPFNYAYDNKRLRAGSEVRRPRGYFDTPAEAFHPDILEKNVYDLKKWVFGA